jgi:ribosomal protein S18 acetylase RimI-like enzyme
VSAVDSITIMEASRVAPAELCGAFNEAFSDYLLKFPILDLDGWRAFVGRQGIDIERSRVAVRGDTVVAFGMITPRPLQRTRIAVMGARIAARGSGAAPRLLDDAVAASVARGDRWIELEAFAQNERAVRLYRSRGFEADADLLGFVAAPSQGLARDEAAREVSRDEAAAWATTVDQDNPALLPWQVGGEAILVALGSPRAWRVGEALLVFTEVNADTITVSVLLDRDAAQRDAVRLIGALRHRYPQALLKAPQIQRADGAAVAFVAAGWTREPLYQHLMRRRAGR